MKMKLRALLAAGAALFVSLWVFTSPASANDFNYTVCGAGGFPANELSVNIGLYGQHAPNYLKVTIGGVVKIDVDFTDQVNGHWVASEDAPFTIDLDTHDGGEEKHISSTFNCKPDTSTTVPASTTTTTVPATTTTVPATTTTVPATTTTVLVTTATTTTTIPTTTTTIPATTSPVTTTPIAPFHNLVATCDSFATNGGGYPADSLVIISLSDRPTLVNEITSHWDVSLTPPQDGTVYEYQIEVDAPDNTHLYNAAGEVGPCPGLNTTPDTTPATQIVVVPTTPQTAPPTPSIPALPATGRDLEPFVWLALGLIVIGGFIVIHRKKTV